MLGSYHRGGSPMSKRPRLNDGYGVKIEMGSDRGANGGESMGGGGGGGRQGILPMLSRDGRDGGGDFGGSSMMPSRVLSARGLLENTMEADLVDALSHFGPVSYVSLTGRGTALVEFEDVAAAERCVTHNRGADIMVLNSPAYFTYANMQLIPRQGLESDRPSNVLILYVQNPKYPISPDIIHAIVKPIARVNRIIVKRQNGILALVEMADVESARVTKQRLNGCDIYSGCCTLKIEYAKMQRLNVVPNDSDHADYAAGQVNTPNENPLGFDEQGRPIYGDSANAAVTGGGSGMDVRSMQAGGAPPFGAGVMPSRGGVGLMDDYQSAAQAQMAALNASGGSVGSQHSQPAFVGGAQPPFGAIGSQGGMLMMGGGGGGGGYIGHGGGGGGFDQGPPVMRPHQEMFHRHPGQHMDRAPAGPDGCGQGEDNAVLMIYGMDPENVNCDKLFNLFCLYGNVMRIKFLKSKNDTVMVQMGDSLAAQRAMDCLRNCTIFGKKMHMALSRQPQLNEVREPLELPDKTTSYRDYSGSRLNRFVTADIASKNRINPPQKFLYFFNAPPGINEDRLIDMVTEQRGPKPVGVKLFSQRGTYAKNSAGLIEFEDESQALEGLMVCNHVLMEGDASRHPFVLKLCFAGPASTGFGGGHGGGFMDGHPGGDRGRDRGDRDRERDYGGGRGGGDREYFDRREGGGGGGGGGGRYNGPGGPRGGDRDRRGGSRDRDRDRGDREGGGREYGRGRGRGRGGRGGR